jgi:DNA topoisomerase-1
LILAICEKDIAARRIAEILSGGQSKQQKTHGIPYYSFMNRSEEFSVMGLRGHIFQVDYPKRLNNWEGIDPQALIDEELIKVPIKKNIIDALKQLAKDATLIIIATDFDREGELIGNDAENVIIEDSPNVQVKRARYSAITREEILHSFDKLEKPYYFLAEAGNTRQEIDLIWGAVLTRFVSVTSGRLGDKFLSVGRVQSPTLALIVERELQIRSFKPELYWQVKVLLRSNGQEFSALHKNDRFDSLREAEKVHERIMDTGRVSAIIISQKPKLPPPPMNTTSLLSNASRIGFSASSAMAAAEALYLKGLISYPRVDNTVFPASIDLVKVISVLSGSPAHGSLAKTLLDRGWTTPTKGKRRSTDHPPIYPTGVAAFHTLTEREMKLYDLVVRMFFACFGPPAISQTTRIEFDISGEEFVLSGTEITQDGWLQFIPYFRGKDDVVPRLSEGDIVEVIDKEILEKETQPPGRYSQGRLIEKMEELGLGTKSTRHTIIKNLYDRGYFMGDPIRPSEMGIAMSQVLKKHAARISTPDMTAELEHDMDLIAEGKDNKKNVVDISRSFLHEIMDTLVTEKQQVAEEIWNGIREDKVIGVCQNCSSDLIIRRARKSKKRFVGCSGYPQCRTAYPLPQKGLIRPTGEVCSECGTPKISLINKGRKPWKICLDPNCPTKQKGEKEG